MSEYVRTFNRFELKFLLHHAQVEELFGRIEPHVRADAHGDEAGSYRVTSLYFDSPDLSCYWEKIDGEKYRRKVRVRTYGAAAADAFVEIKQRYNLAVQKRRARVPLMQVRAAMTSIERGDFPEDADPVFGEVFNLSRRLQLQPRIVVSYLRTALFDRYKKDLRITIDRNLRARHLDLDLEGRAGGVWFLPPTWMILEVKFNEVIPRWICTCLNSMDLQASRLSKYCRAIERFEMQLKTAVL